MVLQAFIDDSYTREGIFVLGGYIASAENWAKFSADWEQMLEGGHGTLSESGVQHFKMSEMAQNAERMARVPGFLRLIEEHVSFAISVELNIADLERVGRSITESGRQINWGPFQNPYLFAFRGMLDSFHMIRDFIVPLLPAGDKVDFYFDNQTEKKFILSAWDGYIQGREPRFREKYGATPRFEDDKEFLPLQAADFWAWWVRRAAESGKTTDLIYNGDYLGHFKESSKIQKLQFFIDDDELLRNFKRLAFNGLGEAS